MQMNDDFSFEAFTIKPSLRKHMCSNCLRTFETIRYDSDSVVKIKGLRQGVFDIRTTMVCCPYCDFILMSEVKSKKAGEDAVEYARRLMG